MTKGLNDLPDAESDTATAISVKRFPMLNPFTNNCIAMLDDASANGLFVTDIGLTPSAVCVYEQIKEPSNVYAAILQVRKIA